MITTELVEFIKSEKLKGNSYQKIKTELLNNKWSLSNIDEAITFIDTTSKNIKSEAKMITNKLDINKNNRLKFYFKIFISILFIYLITPIFIVLTFGLAPLLVAPIYGLAGVIIFIIVIVYEVRHRTDTDINKNNSETITLVNNQNIYNIYIIISIIIFIFSLYYIFMYILPIIKNYSIFKLLENIDYKLPFGYFINQIKTKPSIFSMLTELGIILMYISLFISGITIFLSYIKNRFANISLLISILLSLFIYSNNPSRIVDYADREIIRGISIITLDKAINTSNLKLCSTIQDGQIAQQCISTVVPMNDIKFEDCSKYFNSDSKEDIGKCQWKAIKSMGSNATKDDCKRIENVWTNQNVINECYLNFAILDKNISYCGFINNDNSTAKNNCYYNILLITKDLKSCQNFSGANEGNCNFQYKKIINNK